MRVQEVYGRYGVDATISPLTAPGHDSSGSLFDLQMTNDQMAELMNSLSELFEAEEETPVDMFGGSNVNLSWHGLGKSTHTDNTLQLSISFFSRTDL
jgi:hypothetical protein